MNLCVRSKLLWPQLLSSVFRLASTRPEIVEHNEQVLIDETDTDKIKEAEIERKRNISRLTQAHYNFINGQMPYDEPKSLAHLTVKYHRKMYGKYGAESGVDPSLCWPTKQEIEDRMEYESVAYPYTIQQMMETVALKRIQAQQKIEQREKELEAKFIKLEQWKKDLNDKIEKKAREVQAAKEKKERLVEEVRRHFGFKLDPRDERFQEMLAKREKEQKKAEKQARRDAKEKTIIAKLQQKNVEMSDGKS